MSKYYKLTLAIEGEESQENAIAVLHFHSNFESVVQEESRLIFSFHQTTQPKVELISVLQDLALCEKWDIEDEPDINWNERYEKSFSPILINEEWGVRATFHPKLDTKHEIIIDPKMSFGTGHHETTKQVMEAMTKIDFRNKKVWDYGSGTGILAIMAEMLGASSVLANDNEEWAYHNSLENAALNHCNKVRFHLGTIQECEADVFLKSEDSFDIIIANITKNILLESALKIDEYSHSGTILLLSGFYESDIFDIEKKYNSIQFSIQLQSILNQWACLVLIKK